jgi:tripartite-type tricarboxylate transporter receptor subunit TctC
MSRTRKKIVTRAAALGCLLGVALALAAPGARAADDYPQRAVTFICPFPAGGGTDILTRLLAQELQDRLKQPFIVENRTGAGTLIAASAVAKSPPDGYMLLLAPVTTLPSAPASTNRCPMTR